MNDFLGQSQRDFLSLRGGYFGAAYDWPWLCENVVPKMRNELPSDTDTLVGIGISGACVVPRLADELNMRWLLVRKEGERSHSWRGVEGDLGHAFAFVDDFISSGETLMRCIEAVRHELLRYPTHKCRYVGAYLYEHEVFEEPYGRYNFEAVSSPPEFSPQEFSIVGNEFLTQITRNEFLTQITPR